MIQFIFHNVKPLEVIVGWLASNIGKRSGHFQPVIVSVAELRRWVLAYVAQKSEVLLQRTSTTLPPATLAKLQFRLERKVLGGSEGFPERHSLVSNLNGSNMNKERAN